MKNRFRIGFLAATLIAGFTWIAAPLAASAADGTFQSTANPGGGTIVTGTVINASLPDATAALLHRVHAELGARPAVAQVARDDRDRSVALLFTANRNGTPYTGIAIVRGGTQTAAVALFDTTARFHTTVDSMMHRLQTMTAASSPSSSHGAVHLTPAEPLVSHSFDDGTGTIGIPSDWTLNVAGGGSASATGPGGAAQVAYNMHFTGIDSSNPRAQMWLRTASPIARQNLHGAVLPYTGDPVKSWVAMYEAVGNQNGFHPEIHLLHSSASGQNAADLTGTLGSGPKTIQFYAHVFVLPPNPNGMWSLSDSHVFVKQSGLAAQTATAGAVLASVRINFGAVNAQADAIRQSYQRMFESEIANDRAQDATRQERTDEFLASDRAAQEGMHKDAVAMENYSLDRAVVVNTTTGEHSTISSGFADTLVQANSNYQKVPAADLLRGVDY
ncbi:MAG TPA: hypothetical protein VGF18_06585 [Candidatus Tumulicola sp.]